HENADAETRLRQEFQMHRGPCHPREKAAEAQSTAFQHGEALADNRHAPFVEVAERSWRGLSFDATLNQPPRIAALLHRHLRHPGQRPPTLREGRGAAAHEDLWMTGHGEIRLDAAPAGAVRRRLEPLARR